MQTIYISAHGEVVESMFVLRQKSLLFMAPIGHKCFGSATPGLRASKTSMCADIQRGDCTYDERLAHLQQRLHIVTQPTYTEGELVPEMRLSVSNDDTFMTGIFDLPLEPMSTGHASDRRTRAERPGCG